MMKVLLVNGSPEERGCTFNCLLEMQETFLKIGVASEIFWIGNNVSGCSNCRFCKDNHVPCYQNDVVNEFLEKVEHFDGIVIGTPVYYGNMTGQLQNFLTRCFYSAPKKFAFKPAAAITVSRRSGSTNAMDAINRYFLMHNMIVVGSYYWNEVYGDKPDETKLDNEGMQCLRKLCYNMEYVMRGLSKVEPFEFPEKHIHTNFISREYLKLLNNK